jgi:hypothetical protein
MRKIIHKKITFETKANKKNSNKDKENEIKIDEVKGKLKRILQKCTPIMEMD